MAGCTGAVSGWGSWQAWGGLRKGRRYQSALVSQSASQPAASARTCLSRAKSLKKRKNLRTSHSKNDQLIPASLHFLRTTLQSTHPPTHPRQPALGPYAMTALGENCVVFVLDEGAWVRCVRVQVPTLVIFLFNPVPSFV